MNSSSAALFVCPSSSEHARSSIIHTAAAADAECWILKNEINVETKRRSYDARWYKQCILFTLFFLLLFLLHFSFLPQFAQHCGRVCNFYGWTEAELELARVTILFNKSYSIQLLDIGTNISKTSVDDLQGSAVFSLRWAM